MSDYVNRQAVIDYLMINMNWYDEDDRIVDDWSEKKPIITDLINGVPSGWISVKERLPEKDKVVLVWLYGDYYIGQYYQNPGNLQMRWRFEDFNLCEDDMSDVTHWMPLPEPPKEESDD